MQKNSVRPLAMGLIVLGALIRVTQALNFAPVGALSLFAGARLRSWQAYALPLALMAITDPLVGGYSANTPFVYGSFLIMVWIGSHLRRTENPLWIGTGAVAGSLQFFLITNFGAWLTSPHLYSRSVAGLVNCYIAGIPFYGRTLASDVFYAGVLFGLHAWLSRMVVRSERVAVTA
ncbi:MAG TPA: DUF6580 family putative transport protein [Candidatus Sulfopaludibacter sp.]|jgi:hypothetical protein|nr:DUF6580 family putative transport protein [Candidatus Sulfopaludibacter sp.]